MIPLWKRECSGVQPCWLLVLFFLALLVLALLPILANVVKAEEPLTVEWVCIDGDGRPSYPCTADFERIVEPTACQIELTDGTVTTLADCLTVDYRQGAVSTPCQRKMEAAMRAMDEWTPRLTPTGDLGIIMPQQWDEEGLKAVIEQWAAVKRECWSKE